MSKLATMLGALQESYPSKSHFTEKDIGDLSGRVYLVTGANSGIGKECARVLVKHNAKVYVACRSEDKAKEAIEDIKKGAEKPDAVITFVKIDLSDLMSVKSGVEDFLSKESRLDVLYNSAGVMFPPIDQLTTQGYDLQFGTNVLGHFYLTKLLLPTLIESTKTGEQGKVRVLTSSSIMHLLSKKKGGPIDYSTLTDTPERKKLGAHGLYSQSKSGDALFARELAKRYGDQGIVSCALNPGNINTGLSRHMSAIERSIMRNLILHPVELGAITQLWAGTSPEGLALNGEYIGPWAQKRILRPDHADDAKCAALWDWCEKQIEQHA